MPAFASPNTRSFHVPHLDGLRAVAALLVLSTHFPYIENSSLSRLTWNIAQQARFGYIGVDLFFILSGFLITRILISRKTSRWKNRYQDFLPKKSAQNISHLLSLRLRGCSVFSFGQSVRSKPADIYIQLLSSVPYGPNANGTRLVAGG